MVVADSSVFVEVLLGTNRAETAGCALQGQQIHAPDLIGFEVLSAIRGKVKVGELSPSDGVQAMRDFEAVEDRLELWPLLEVMTRRSLDLRENVTSYDTTYVSLAEILVCPLITADARLGRAVENLIDVVVV